MWTNFTRFQYTVIHVANMLKTLVFIVFILAVSSENVRVKRAKYYSYPSRFYRKPPPPHVVKGAFSYTPPPNYMHEDEPYRTKVSKRPTNEGLGNEDINNLMKHLTKKDLDKIIEFAAEKERYNDNLREDPNENYEYKQGFRRPERNNYRNDDIEQFAQNIHHFREPDEVRHYKVELNDPNDYTGAKSRILHPTLPTYSEDFDKNPNSNYVNDASQTKVIYSNPPEKYNTKITYSNHQEPQQFNTIPTSHSNSPQFSSNPGYSDSQITFSNAPLSNSNPFSNYQQQFPNNPHSNPNMFHSNPQGPNNVPLDSEESVRQYEYISYVTVPPNKANEEYIFAVPPDYNKENLFTDSSTMKEEQLPRPLNLREDDYDVANTNNVPKVVTSDTYSVESFKDIPLMNHDDSKLHTVSSYHVPHYLVTATKSQQLPQQQPARPSSLKSPQIEKAPAGYTGKEMSDAHLKAVRIWTHRSKGMAYTLHNDGTLSLEKPKIRTSYGYIP